jgi:trehalose utilization protein
MSDGATRPLHVTIWNEGRHEQEPDREVIYPDGIHGAIQSGIRSNLGSRVTTGVALLDEPGAGLSDEVLDKTDVLVWWGHIAHRDVPDEVVERVHQNVLAGMGLIVLHSGHWSKIFRKLMGTTCTLNWRNGNDIERVWTIDPTHPITEGVPNPIMVGEHEMYGERFDIPTPDELIFVSSFTGGEVFRSGCTFRRGNGRIFYFSPGDQDYPIYHHKDVLRVISNGVMWAARPDRRQIPEMSYVAP